MRDFQNKSNIGAIPDSNSPTKLGGGEATSLRTENKNAVERAGLALAPQDGVGEILTQLAQSLMINGMGASSFQSAGTANAITLTPITGASGLLLPSDYGTLDGMQISFFPGFTNTAATTFSIGQTGGTQFGTKKILDNSGAELVGGEIVEDRRVDLIYDASADGGSGAAIIRSVSGAAGAGLQSVQTFTASGTWNKPAGITKVKVTVVGGGGGGSAALASESGSGGGAGAYSQGLIDVTAISSETVTIGAGGAADNNGNTSSFGAHVSCTGGVKGVISTGNDTGGDGGIATGGFLNVEGGGGGSAGGTANASEGGGNSVLGFTGVTAADITLPLRPSVGFGAGGSGSRNGNIGKAGTIGIIIVEEYA